MLRPAALLALLLLVVPAVLAAGPSLAPRVTREHVQDFVDTLVSLPQARPAFQEGDGILVGVGDEVWNGIVRDGRAIMSAGDAPRMTHRIYVDPAAMLSIVNAFDPANTAKLAIKRHHIEVHSDRASVNAAVGALARTPFDDRLRTMDPLPGDRITFQGCSGVLGPKRDRLMIVELCGDRYQVNELGGVSAKLPPAHLGAAPPGIELSPDAGASFGSGLTTFCRDMGGTGWPAAVMRRLALCMAGITQEASP